MRFTALLLALSATLGTDSVLAQTLARRIDAVRDGTIRMAYATRPEVCGDGRFIGIDTPRGFRMYTFHGNGPLSSGYSVELLEDVQPECQTGPLRLVVEKAGGRITDLRAAVGVEWRRATGVTDLGTVSAADAAGWLLDNAATFSDELQAVAFVAAIGADSTRVADRLLAIARNQSLSAPARSQALRWLTDVTAREGKPAAADETIRGIIRDENDVAAVRDRAIRDLDVLPANDAFLRDAFGRISPTTLRDRVIRRLALSDTPENVAWIRALVLDTRETRTLRDRALQSLGDVLKRRADVESLYSRLEDPELKSRALRLLAQSGDASSLARLRTIALSENEPITVRDQAVRVLSEARDDASLRWLQSLVTNTTQPVQIRDRAIRVLAERRALEFLQQTYSRLDQAALKDRAIRSIAEMQGADSRAWLMGIASNDQERDEIRDRAIRSLAERGAPSADLATLYDRVTSTGLQQRVVRLLAERGDDVAVEKLTVIADKDPDPEMRRFALRRLGETRNAKARAFLERKI